MSVGVSPNSEQKLTDIRREATTVTTALRARPHLDFTISIFPVTQTKKHYRLVNVTEKLAFYKRLTSLLVHLNKL